MSRSIRIILSVVMLLAVSAGISWFFMGMKEAPAKNEVSKKKRYVKALPVQYDTIRTEVEASGRLLSSRSYSIAAEVQGKILAGDVPLKKGQSFKEGELLFRIYDDDVVQALHASKSRFLTSLANILPDFKIDFPQNFKAWNDFFMAVDIKQPLPELPEITDRQEKTFLASRNVLSDYYSIIGEEIRMKKYAVYAPFDGSYTNVQLETGAIANPGSRVADIIRTDVYELEVPVEVENVNAISQGEQVMVFNEERNSSWKGIVVRKADFVDPETQSVPVFVRLKPKNGQPLFEGQYLLAVFPGKDLAGSMEIPRNAVFNHDEVFVVENGRLTKKVVEILQVNDQTLVFKGIKEGVQLVVEPLVSASEGISVETIAP